MALLGLFALPPGVRASSEECEDASRRILPSEERRGEEDDNDRANGTGPGNVDRGSASTGSGGPRGFTETGGGGGRGFSDSGGGRGGGRGSSAP